MLWKAVEMIVEVDMATEKGKDKPGDFLCFTYKSTMSSAAFMDRLQHHSLAVVMVTIKSGLQNPLITLSPLMFRQLNCPMSIPASGMAQTVRRTRQFWKDPSCFARQ